MDNVTESVKPLELSFLTEHNYYSLKNINSQFETF